jgi:transcriptional/translational regulatory protein YebC/TACO1
VCEALGARFGDPSSARIIWRPLNTISVEGEAAHSLLRLVDALEEHDDVQNVYANFDVSEADLATMTA